MGGVLRGLRAGRSRARVDRPAQRARGMAALAQPLARRVPHRFFACNLPARPARGRVGVFVTKVASSWVAIVHRLSGTALALFLPLHFWALGNALQLEGFLAWTEQPL